MPKDKNDLGIAVGWGGEEEGILNKTEQHDQSLGSGKAQILYKIQKMSGTS